MPSLQPHANEPYHPFRSSLAHLLPLLRQLAAVLLNRPEHPDHLKAAASDLRAPSTAAPPLLKK